MKSALAALSCVLAALLVSAALSGPAAASRPPGHPRGLSLAARGVPSAFVSKALCVHDGWHHKLRRPWARTWDVPDSIKGGRGEGGWHTKSLYRGGLQWSLGTWARAGGRGDPADASPAEEIFRAYVIVRRNGGRWTDWPWTARACGLPT